MRQRRPAAYGAVMIPDRASSSDPPLVNELRQDYQASPGWDPVTGWGSPNAQVLLPRLASYASH
jgi:hypothetical protein